MDLATFRRLLTPEGQALLAEATAGAASESDLALGTRLRREHDADLVAAAVSQVRLRAKARTKLGDDAASMYFTPDALEQATRATVARLRAERLARSAERVVDLGCGIGGDLVAFARAGVTVRGVERDPVRAAIARANLEALGLDGEVIEGDLADVTLAADEVPFLDPARRSGAGRVFDPAAMEPPWDVVLQHLRGRAVVKTLPGLDHGLVPDDVEAQWVSDGGDLVEACLWGPGLAEVPRRATVLPGERELAGSGEPGVVGEVGGFLHEPDDSVIRAGLVGELAARMGSRLVDPHIAYVTTDDAVTDPLARSFRIDAELPFREKQLRAALRERGVGTLTVKKRGVDVVPERLVQRLRLRGEVTATVVMTRVAGEGRAFLVDPL
ncbi:class I SAM-dependent methyltransferase [Aeromicrobium terrae]|uniref:Methyltransferase n=1 Tax=Aeromicrobium terrae TaxID=2498846 RepID=A0A5C8NFC8_9ACTN|nr:methyltransferase domain-containing protein [Aeromicrobium terrae]TXL57228.1 methyltransferase [Aeromicrobium terrae]